MLARRKTLRLQQLDLFRPQPTVPRWENLSPEIQRQSLSLLARLLRTSLHARPTADGGKETSDE
jgi:hypothetical protein